MQFASEARRAFWKAMLYAIVIDLGIAAAIIWLFNRENFGFLTVGIAYLAIEVIHILVQIRGFFVSILIARDLVSDSQVDAVAKQLRAEGFRADPTGYYRDAISYFEEVVGDSDQDIEVRLKAASYSAMLALTGRTRMLVPEVKQRFEMALSRL